MPYKTAVMRPHRAVIKRGRGKSLRYEEVPLEGVLAALARDARALADLVEWQLRSEPDIARKVKEFSTERPGLSVAKVGEYMGFRLPKNTAPQPSGKSRFERMFQARVVSEALSWHERSAAEQGTSSRHVSQGWRRTASDIVPSDLVPKMPLSATDERYYRMSGDPPRSGEIVLDLVISGAWHRLYFQFDAERFSGAAKVCAPDIVVRRGRVQFNFAVEYEYNYSSIGAEYRIGVDVGVVHPATATVVNRRGEIVHTTTLSRRVNSLKNSIAATARQVRSLQAKNRPAEAALHRKANSKKKRELAVLIGQEVAELQHFWGNAVVVVEDLSWVTNTMQNGRWNRGEVVRWIEHFCGLNGGLVMRRNAAYTSQTCHRCGERGTLKARDFMCRNNDCDWCEITQDRDINAAANIAMRVKLDTVNKCVRTRNSRRKKKGVSRTKNVLRTPKTRQTLRYPGRDRTKSGPTPRRPRKRKVTAVHLPPKEVNNSSGTSGALRPTVSLDAPGEVSRAWDFNQLPDPVLELQKHRS